MDLEEIKSIWESQDDQPLDPAERRALHAGIRHRALHFANFVGATDWILLLAWFGLAAFYLVEPLAYGDDRHQLASAAILLALCARHVVHMRRRRTGARTFEESLHGDLDRAIWQVDYHIAWARSLRRWELPLTFVAASIDILFNLSPSLALIWVALAAVLALGGWGIEWEIRAFYLPKQRRYKQVRRKLDEADPHLP